MREQSNKKVDRIKILIWEKCNVFVMYDDIFYVCSLLSFRNFFYILESRVYYETTHRKVQKINIKTFVTSVICKILDKKSIL